MRKTYRLTMWLAFVVFSLWSADAFACKCEKSIKPVSGSKMIFWGKALEIKPRGAQDRVEFEVTELFKGDERDAVSVYTNRFQHDCGIRFEVDKTYMVYAYDFYPRGVATSLCWGTYEAAEPVSGEAWSKVDVKEPEDSEFEEDLRDMGKNIVQKCGAQHRVYDAGFSMIASPDGDPVRPKVKRTRAREKLQGFRDCVTDAFLQQDELPRPKESVRLEGWYQRDVKALPVLLDQLPCGEDCPDWERRVKTVLMLTELPHSDDQTTVNLRSEYNQCLTGGIATVGGESHGATSFQRLRDRMLADCAAARGEFEYLDPYLDAVDNETLMTALKWGMKAVPPASKKPKKKTDGGPDAGGDAGDDRADFVAGSTGAGRAAEVFPLTKNGEWAFVAAAIRGEAKVGDYRVLRAGFLDDDTWYQNPIYLEAFAQAILADESATGSMRDLASLAFHRAGKLAPGAAEGYASLAADASSSAAPMREEFDKAWSAAHTPVVEEVDEVEEFDEVEEVVEAPEEEDRSMLLIVAGVLIVVALLGIGTILKRRK